jgi:ABC-2 type transport system permease protein
MSRGWWSEMLLVAGRERRERMRARSFRISTAVLVVVVVLGVGLPALIGGGRSATKVAVTGAHPQRLAATVRRAGRVLDHKVTPQPVTGAGRAHALVADKRVALAYIGGRKLLVRQRPAKGTSDSDFDLARAIAQLAGTRGAPAARALPVRGLQPPLTDLSTRLTGMVVIILIYILVFIYGQRITSGVAEEKSSRVIEVLLASVRPGQMLAGKVLGMGAVALAQVVALVATFAVVAAATGSDLINGAAIDVVAVGAVWLILGYALHCTAFAAAGSLITRESEASNVTFPIVIPLLVAYVLSFQIIFQSSPSGFYQVLAYLPPTAPVAMTTLYAAGSAGLGEVAISAAICVLATIALARVAARVYERSILRMGRRVRLGQALRSETLRT